MTRFRLELNSPGDFKSKDKITSYVKDAYLQWKFGMSSIFLGISPTPTWEQVEKHFGYRHVEKTPLDLQKFGDPRDFGIAFSGSLDKAGKLRYHFLVGNGESLSSEVDKQKKYYLSLGFNPTQNLYFEIYGDFKDSKERKQIYTYQGFWGFKGEKMRMGFLFANQVRFLGRPDFSSSYTIRCLKRTQRERRYLIFLLIQQLGQIF